MKSKATPVIVNSCHRGPQHALAVLVAILAFFQHSDAFGRRRHRVVKEYYVMCECRDEKGATLLANLVGVDAQNGNLGIRSTHQPHIFSAPQLVVVSTQGIVGPGKNTMGETVETYTKTESQKRARELSSHPLSCSGYAIKMDATSVEPEFKFETGPQKLASEVEFLSNRYLFYVHADVKHAEIPSGAFLKVKYTRPEVPPLREGKTSQCAPVYFPKGKPEGWKKSTITEEIVEEESSDE